MYANHTVTIILYFDIVQDFCSVPGFCLLQRFNEDVCNKYYNLHILVYIISYILNKRFNCKPSVSDRENNCFKRLFEIQFQITCITV